MGKGNRAIRIEDVKWQIWKGNLVELFDNSQENVMDMTSVSQQIKMF